MIIAICKVCGTKHYIEVPMLEIIKYFMLGEEAFQELNEELQFLMKTGVCWDCWEEKP